MEKKYTFEEFQKIVQILRSENGCPWDRVQTHETLESCMIEEAYEVVEGIHLLKENGNSENLCEELGDVLLQVVFHSQLAEEEGLFTLKDVIRGISEKMIRRHPHVFGNTDAENNDQIRLNWEEIKKLEKQGKKDKRHELDTVARALPALIRCEKVQKKLVHGGYEERESEQKIYEHMSHILDTLQKKETEMSKKDEIGELLYQICNLAKLYDVSAEEALTDTLEEKIKIAKILDKTGMTVYK